MRLQMLGPLRVTTGTAELGSKDFRGAKPKQVLQLLALERGHIASKGWLADQLWGDELPQNHLATLEAYVSVLRRTLEPTATARDSVVVTERGGYRLDADRVTVDLDEFDTAVAQAVGAEPSAALDALRRGLALVRGEALEDEPYAEWALQTRETYRQRHVQALIDAGRLSLLTGDPPAALALAERAVELSPLAEPAYQVLMTAAYSLWRQDEALAAFDRCRRLLADELGADPLDETVALHLSILRHEDIAQLLPGHPVEVARPAAGGESLPLLHREQELRLLHNALERALGGRFTVALVTGAWGLGKSRLLEAFAQSVDVPTGTNRCSDLERDLPYLSLALALRQVLPGLSEQGLPVLDVLLDRVEDAQPFDEFARLRVMETLASVLPDQPPFVLMLDDAAWADPQTIATLNYLQRRCPEARVLVVLTSDRRAAVREPLRSLRPDLRLELREFTPESVEALGGPELRTAAGGNPAHISSWLEARARGLDEPFTHELRERIVTSLWDRGPEAYRVLSAASAVDAPTFTVAGIASLLDAPVRAVSETLDLLYEHDLLVAVGEELAFRSPAVRSVLNGMLSPSRRVLLQQTGAQHRDDGPRRRAADRLSPRPVPQRRATDRFGDDGRDASPLVRADGRRMPSSR